MSDDPTPINAATERRGQSVFLAPDMSKAREARFPVELV
jgi:hypothetical protein